MPANFPTADQKRHYSRYTGEPTPQQLGQHFHLSEADLSLLQSRRHPHTRLGMAVQLGTLRFLGCFLPETQWFTVPQNVIAYQAAQLTVAVSEWSRYLRRPATLYEHQGVLCAQYGYRVFSDPQTQTELVEWLEARISLHDEPPSVLFDHLVTRLKNQKVLLPGITTLERLLMEVRSRIHQQIWTQIDQQLTPDQRTRLQQLVVSENYAQSDLDRLRNGPDVISPVALKAALERIDELAQIGLTDIDISELSPDRVKKLAAHAAISKADTINRLSEPRKWATLAAFAHVYESRAIDDALDLFDALVQTRLTRASQTGEKQRLRTLRDLDMAARQLHDVGVHVLDLPADQPIVLDVVLFNVFSRTLLTAAISQVETLTRPPDDHYYEQLLNHYSQFRRFLPTFWNTLSFNGTETQKELLDAVAFLKQLETRNLPTLSPKERQQITDEAPQAVIEDEWRPLVIDNDGHIHLRYYTFCVLLQLREALRQRTVFEENSERWGDIRNKLLSDANWREVKEKVCQTLGHSTNPHQVLDALSQQLDTAYQQVADNLSANTKARLETADDKVRVILEPLTELEEPPSLLALREALHAMLPRVDIQEIVQEVAAWTGCLDEFVPISGNPIRAQDITLTLSAVLSAEAMNLGLTPFVNSRIPALTRGRLTWVQYNYVRTETIVRSNARLVAAQDAIPLAQHWGGGEVAVADGLRFVVPVRSAHAAASRRYFGTQRGITWYHWMLDQYVDMHGIVVTGSLRDAPWVLDGFLEQETHQHPKELITDTGGYSDIVFGFFWLLGYQFSPRLADLGDTRFWRLHRDRDYGPLNELARHKADGQLVIDNWDDILRAAGSLTMGTVKASELIKSLHRAGRTSTLGRAIGALGRIAKTRFLLSYIDDEVYRRRILTQLTRIEHRHRLARAVCFGKRGNIYQSYREGQEDQLNALGLVLNMIVLWNTRYMNAALEHLRETGFDVRPEDIERLSPLVSLHINFVGRYPFSLPEHVKRGELRPFNNPDDPAYLM